MLWFWFVIGFVMGIIGVFISAYDKYTLTIKGITFDTDVLGLGMGAVGFILAFLMLLAKGVAWLASYGG